MRMKDWKSVSGSGSSTLILLSGLFQSHGITRGSFFLQEVFPVCGGQRTSDLWWSGDPECLRHRQRERPHTQPDKLDLFTGETPEEETSGWGHQEVDSSNRLQPLLWKVVLACATSCWVINLNGQGCRTSFFGNTDKWSSVSLSFSVTLQMSGKVI